ncbi:hypothetical protein M407DRAFT_9090 [Tulasnella calospora MUT 4182]|uniref:Uncharacterized protein n=1 Tax=Tulasnella calospora MUT 4182 TaxID=1051891 RepID=A0A0C3Q4Z4_9AGAM|nr:hypothetical protein M407DRAFT_9090 [Tulasnella calospora MUT 4182]
MAIEKSDGKLCMDCQSKPMEIFEAEEQHFVENGPVEFSSKSPSHMSRISLLLARVRKAKDILDLGTQVERPPDPEIERKLLCEAKSGTGSQNCNRMLKGWSTTDSGGWIVTSKYCQAPAERDEWPGFVEQAVVHGQPLVNPGPSGGGLHVPSEETCYSESTPLFTPGYSPRTFSAQDPQYPALSASATQFQEWALLILSQFEQQPLQFSTRVSSFVRLSPATSGSDTS